MTTSIVWENVPGDQKGLQRSRTPTGWLVREYQDVMHPNLHDYVLMSNGYDWRVALTFVPDPEHVWLKAPPDRKQVIQERLRILTDEMDANDDENTMMQEEIEKLYAELDKAKP